MDNLATFSLNLKPIAFVDGCFPDKFVIPRQSKFSQQARAKIVFTQDYQDPDWLQGLDFYSHLWLIWGFHQHFGQEKISPKVRPQRLGGNTKMGTFSTRSSFRPNPLGLSVVKIEEICVQKLQPNYVLVSGHDLQNDTPIYDLKPYLPEMDQVTEAVSTFSVKPVSIYPVVFLDKAQRDLKLHQSYIQALECTFHFDFRLQIEELIAQDPRPPYHARKIDAYRIYGFRLYAFEIKFIKKPQQFEVVSIDLFS